MSIFTDADAAILATDLGEPVTYRKNGQPDAIIVGVWKDDVSERRSPGFYGVLFVNKAISGISPNEGDLIVRNGTQYTICEMTNADAAGGVYLKLQKVR